MSISLAEINVNHGGDYLAEFAAANELDKPAFEILSPDELFSRPPRQMLIDGLLAVGDIAMAVGEAGGGKTIVAHDMAACCISGRRFADYFDVLEPLRVHYATGEGQGGLSIRLQAAFARHGITPHEQRNLSISLTTPQLFKPSGNGAAEFVDSYRSQRGDKLDLLILDTWHNSIVGGNENESKDIGVIFENARHIRNMLGCSILLIHHVNKAGLLRGSTSIPGALDMIAEVKKIGQRHSLRCLKMKDGKEFPDMAFSLIAKGESVVPFWEGKMDGDGDTRSGKTNEDISAIVALLKENPGFRFDAKRISEAIGQSQSYTDKLLKIARDKAGIRRELLDSAKGSSSRNPWMYAWLPDDGVVKEADGMDW
jgi:hypothetical protein